MKFSIWNLKFECKKNRLESEISINVQQQQKITSKFDERNYLYSIYEWVQYLQRILHVFAI